MQVLPIATDQS